MSVTSTYLWVCLKMGSPKSAGGSCWYVVGWLVDIIILRQCHLGLSPVLTSLIYLMGIQQKVVIELGTFLFLMGNTCTFVAKIYEHTVCLDMGVFPQPLSWHPRALVAGEIGKIRRWGLFSHEFGGFQPWVYFGWFIGDLTIPGWWLMVVNGG